MPRGGFPFNGFLISSHFAPAIAAAVLPPMPVIHVRYNAICGKAIIVFMQKQGWKTVPLWDGS
jgi:hypothetical protein